MPTKTHVHTRINGEEVDFLCEPRQSLLECLRDVIGLTGSKEGCNDGNCGAYRNPGWKNGNLLPSSGS